MRPPDADPPRRLRLLHLLRPRRRLRLTPRGPLRSEPEKTCRSGEFGALRDAACLQKQAPARESRPEKPAVQWTAGRPGAPARRARGCRLDRRSPSRARAPRVAAESRPPPAGASAAGFVDGRSRQAAPSRTKSGRTSPDPAQGVRTEGRWCRRSESESDAGEDIEDVAVQDVDEGHRRPSPIGTPSRLTSG